MHVHICKEREDTNRTCGLAGESIRKEVKKVSLFPTAMRPPVGEEKRCWYMEKGSRPLFDLHISWEKNKMYKGEKESGIK